MRIRDLHVTIQYLEKTGITLETFLYVRHKLIQSWKPEVFQEAIVKSKETMLSKT